MWGLPPEVPCSGQRPEVGAEAAGAQVWGLSRPADGGTGWWPPEGTSLLGIRVTHGRHDKGCVEMPSRPSGEESTEVGISYN